MADPRNSPTVKGVIRTKSQKVDNDRSEGWIETFIYEENGKFFTVTHYELTYTGMYTAKTDQNDWSPPEEISQEKYNEIERSLRR